MLLQQNLRRQTVMADYTFDWLVGHRHSRHVINTLCTDHLEPYANLFEPETRKPAAQAQQQHSFKISTPTAESQGKSAYMLDQVHRRFAWHWRSLKDVCGM